MCAWFYDASDVTNPRITHSTLLGTSESVLRALFATAAHPGMPRQLLARHWATPAGAVSELIGPEVERFVPWCDQLYPIGIRDIVTINAYDTDGRGVAVNSLMTRRARLSLSYVEQLERVAAHLIAAHRIRRQSGPVEAVVTPDGDVVHARGEAAARHIALSSAVRSIEHARGQLRRRAPGEALAAWHALVEARWSLVDFFDSDGKRFLVARVNEFKAAVHSRLTAREAQVVALVGRGHSNKLIAYELGIAQGTVAAHVSSAMAKLGVSNRAGLVTAYASFEDGVADETPDE